MASRTIRGIRTPLPPGFVVGRPANSGRGAAQLLSIADIAQQMQATGIVVPAAGAPPSSVVLAGAGISVSVSGSSYTVALSSPVTLARGGTGADLSATGGTHQVLKQSSVGGAVTVGQLAFTDISGSVPNSQLATMTSHTFKGNNTGSTVVPLDLTATQLTAELNVVVGDSGSGGTKGLVPAPAAGDTAAGKFLKADGTYAVPSGGGGSSTLAGDTDVSISGPTNGQVLTYDTGTSKWKNAAAGGGSSGGLYSGVMSAVPTQASTGLTSWANQPASFTVADNAVGVTVTGPAQGAHNPGIIKVAAPATPYSISALIAHTGLHTNFNVAVFGWWNGLAGGSAKETMFHHGYADGMQLLDYTGLNAATLAATGPGVQTGIPDILWYKLRDDGTNVTFSFSQDGVSWIAWYTVAKASGFLGATGYSNIVFGVNSFSLQAWATLMSWTVGV